MEDTTGQVRSETGIREVDSLALESQHKNLQTEF
jgi:hypothetical protein